MATPANPFAVLHQTDGVASSTGRGRGGQFRGSTHFQPRGASAFQPRGGSSNVTRDPNFRGRGRGRGAPTATRAGRGNARGAGAAGNTWRVNKQEQKTTPTPSAFSPFAQLKQNPPPASPVTAPAPQQTPASSGFGRESPVSFGAPSNRGATTVNARRDPRKRPSAKPTNGVAGASVPVEDSSAMSSYNDRYEQLKIDRAKQREQAIKAGQMADPNQPMSLNKAITPVGTCTSMCPEFERVERLVQKMVDKSEKYLHPATNSLQNMEAKMLKRFRRSAAGYDEQLPSDIRTPGTLLQSMNYLTRHVIGGPEPLGIIHKFVWDRTRSIRNDFSVQQVTQEEDVKIAVTCLERIARFHIMSLHLLSSPANEGPFDRHQEREQLNNTMLSLMYYYDDNRGRISFPNEDEFRAYYIIFSIHDQRPDLEARVQKWPPELRSAPRVRVALELFAAAGNTWEYQGTLDAKRPSAIAQGFYARFFSLVDSPGVSYLMACVAEIYFNHMRQTAIRSIWKGYCRYPSSQQHKNEEWTVDELTNVLCFDSDDQTIQFCEEQDLEFAENANGDLYLNWGSRPVDSVAFQPSSDHSFSETYVESKRAGRNLVAIILGLNVKEAATLGMVDKSFLSERVSTLAPAGQMSVDNDESLFVSEDENEVSPIPGSSGGSITMTSELSAGPAMAFGEFSQPAIGVVQGPTSGLSSPPKPSEPQPPAASNLFSSHFPANNSLGNSTTPPPPSLSPFAQPFSPFSSSPTPEASQPATASPNLASSDQSPSVFSNSGTFAQPSQNGNAPTPPAATPFIFPNVSQPTTSQTHSSSPSQNVQNPTTSNTSPFGAPSPFSVKPNPPSDLTAGQSSTNIFNIASPITTPEAQTPLFNFDKPPEPATQERQTGTPETSPPQPPAEPTQLFPLPSDLEKEKKDPISLFSAPKTPQFSVFKAPVTTSVAPTSADQSSESQPVSLTNGDTSNTTPPLPSNGIIAPQIPTKSLISNEAEPAPSEPVVDIQSDVPEVETPAVEAIREEQVPDQAEEEAKRQAAWINSLREAADRRRNIIATPASRKRVLEHETPPTENVKKAPKAPKPDQPPRKSMALSSVKPLPKLPILEQIEAMTARRPVEQKPEPRKPSHVDGDDLLLSAARIAAESLRSGPRLIGGASVPYEPWRSSFSPGSSVSSVAFSRSQSPQQSIASGYDVSLAPDSDLGLGRSMSRTEQRIRMTGGKGLAYKPLNLTPNKSWRTPPKK
ncbi:SAC3/GANP/Nin1/mts3/eIF-3 p25 family-domain-containing protein [Aspergillus varians]